MSGLGMRKTSEETPQVAHRSRGHPCPRVSIRRAHSAQRTHSSAAIGESNDPFPDRQSHPHGPRTASLHLRPMAARWRDPRPPCASMSARYRRLASFRMVQMPRGRPGDAASSRPPRSLPAISGQIRPGSYGLQSPDSWRATSAAAVGVRATTRQNGKGGSRDGQIGLLG
jgi:hypothetical protein